MTFGDIIRIGEVEYIFLTFTEEDIAYVAKILDRENSVQVESYCTRAACKTHAGDSTKTLLCCYVKLTTEGLKNKLAHLNESANARELLSYCTTGIQLNAEDKEMLRKEITDPEVPLPGELKELIKEISLI
jgi:hypothetical protein